MSDFTLLSIVQEVLFDSRIHLYRSSVRTTLIHGVGMPQKPAGDGMQSSFTDEELRTADVVSLIVRDTKEPICDWNYKPAKTRRPGQAAYEVKVLRIEVDAKSDDLQAKVQQIASVLGSLPQWPQVDEDSRRYFTKEEEFLDEFGQVPWVAARLLDGDWRPDPSCNDVTRQQRKYFLEHAELTHLVFDGAAIFHERKTNRFSSAQIVLKSSNRNVSVRVRSVGDGFVAEKMVDKPA